MKTYELNTMYQINQVEDPIIGRIDYLNGKGVVVDSTEYDNAKDFVQDIKDELSWDVPIAIFLYSDENGNTISTTFIKELDRAPQGGFHIVDAPVMARA